MTGPYRLARALAFRVEAERAHAATLAGLAAASHAPGALRLLSWTGPVRDARLAVSAFGARFPNPLGVAAGLDKDGRAVPALAALGFGAVEVGTVTARPQPGNPRPRLFRLPRDEALINRMGFNNGGAGALAARLAHVRRAAAAGVPIGVNVGKSRAAPPAEIVADHRAAVRAVRGVADYLVVNVSSPNTPGVRELQQADALRALLAAVVEEALGTPLLLKLSPDLPDARLAAIAELADAAGVAGLVACNTTVARPGLRRDPGEAGGLSGRPLAPRARAALRVLRAHTDLPLVSVGGIDGPWEALARLAAGADLLQVYTAFIYQGPALVGRILAGLSAELDRSGAPDLASWRRSGTEAFA